MQVNNKSIFRKRIFVVGVPRSGTTLVQSILNAHQDIFAFPETHFYRYFFPRNRYLRMLFMASRGTYQAIDKLEENLAGRGIDVGKCRRSLFRDIQSRLFIDYLDLVAATQNCAHWAEKTPAHLHNIDYIERTVRDAYFIHVVREPYSVVASMFEAARDYPEIWGRRTIQDCCNRWNDDIGITLSCSSRSNHTILSYDLLNKDPDFQTGLLLDFLGIDDSGFDADRIGKSAFAVVDKDEPWKHRNSMGLVNYQSKKYQTIFDDAEKKSVKKFINGSLQAQIEDNY